MKLLSRYHAGTILAALFFFCFLAGCSVHTDKAAITKLVKLNITSCQQEKMEAYMATLHSGSPARATTENILEQIFSNYDLKYKLDRLKILSVTEDAASVQAIQTTTLVKGPSFRNNQVDYNIELRKENGSWKIWNSTINHIDYLK